MSLSADSAQGVIGETVAAAIGRAHRVDAIEPATGGPAGNARLTAWIGLALLVLFLVESATLISLSSLLVVHLFVGAFLVPLVLLKTATTGWRMLRYYTGSERYVASGPPPLLLRLLGPAVVVGALAVLGTGLSLVALGQSAHDELFSVPGFRVDAVALHQAAFILWLATSSLHLLGRFVPALQLSRLVSGPESVPRTLPGTMSRLGLVGLTLAVAVATGALVLSLGGSWRHQSGDDHHDRHDSAGSTSTAQLRRFEVSSPRAAGSTPPSRVPRARRPW